jgi:hypothetical protein
MGKKWLGALWDMLRLVITGVLGGVLGFLLCDTIVVKQPFFGESRVVVDSLDSRQGRGCLEWTFHIQPARELVFSGKRLVGCFLHMEVLPDSLGRLDKLNLTGYEGMRFYAKSTAEMLTFTECNLFTGDDYVHYVCSTRLIPSTKWRELYIDFGSFVLASNLRDSMERFPGRVFFPEKPDLSAITAFGWDMKTVHTPLMDKVWIDNLRAVDPYGTEFIISEAESLESMTPSGVHIRWVSDWRKYRHPPYPFGYKDD